jgi:hypothetical protein
MALTKVTKHIVYGSVLIAHYGADMADKSTSSASYSQWGSNITVTPQYADSHLEIVLTGSAWNANSNHSGTSDNYAAAKFVVNGQDEYVFRGIIGGRMSITGGHNHQNQQFGENNGRQNWRYYGYGSAIYMNHIHAPGTTNAQAVGCHVAVENGQFNCTFAEGFMTISEISGEHHNLT